MLTLTLASDLAAPAAEVWDHVTTMCGINDELGPWLTMRSPRRWRDAAITDLPLGEPLGRAWLLLGGVMPVEYDDLVVTEHEPGRMFQERSSLMSARVWTHRRTVEPYGDGCRVTDVVGVEGRWPLLTPVVAWVAGRLFHHRHRRLVGRFGAAPR